jgi:hypothetical protein
VNVALIRLLGEEEYRLLSRLAVPSKYYLATRLGLREEWFGAGENVLEVLDELFTERNKLVHAQPEGWPHPDSAQPPPPAHQDLSNVARWLLATIEAVDRLSRSHGELAGFDRVAGRLLKLEPLLQGFDPGRDGKRLDQAVRAALRGVLEEEKEVMLEEDFQEMMEGHDPDWDLPGLDRDEHSSSS